MFLHDEPATAERVGAPFSSKGWSVYTAGLDITTIDTVASLKPLAAVFCLEGCQASRAEELAAALIDDERLLRPLMVFVGGEPAHIASIKQRIPMGVFVYEDELPWVLKHLSIKF